MRKFYFSIILSFSFFVVVAQQLPDMSTFALNPQILSPVYCGEYDFSNLNLHYRNQWTGIEGAPETTILTFDTPVKPEKIGLGIVLLQDNSNIIQQQNILGNYSYLANINGDHFIRFGLGFGVIKNALDFDKIRAQNMDEQSILNNVHSKTSIDANLGLNYQFKNLRIGLFAQHLVNSKLSFENH